MNITISSDIIKALCVIAPKDDIRYYLKGVCVDSRANGDVVLVATNGHMLLAVPVSVDAIESLIVGEFIIPREAFESVKPEKIGRSTAPLRIVIDQPAPEPDLNRPGVTVQKPATFAIQGATTATGTVIDGRYPDWRRVFPASASGQVAQFQPAYIAAFGQIAKLLTGKENHPVIHHNGSQGALVSHLGASALGIIMPLREDDTTHPGLPAWARKD